LNEDVRRSNPRTDPRFAQSGRLPAADWSGGVNRIARKAARLSNLRITHVSSTYYGGGVAEILSPLTLLMNACGISTDWHIIQGHPVFLL
jgi:hypothetical protein